MAKIQPVGVAALRWTARLLYCNVATAIFSQPHGIVESADEPATSGQ